MVENRRVNAAVLNRGRPADWCGFYRRRLKRRKSISRYYRQNEKVSEFRMVEGRLHICIQESAVELTIGGVSFGLCCSVEVKSRATFEWKLTGTKR